MVSKAAGLLDSAVADGVIPGAVLVTGRGAGGSRPLHAVGHASISEKSTSENSTSDKSTSDKSASSIAENVPIEPDTVFDLASLTKVVATLPTVLSLVDHGDIGLDDPVMRYLPAFAGLGKAGVTVRQLLSHTSGLPDGQPFYALDVSIEERWNAVLAAALVAQPGSVMCYSDIGFMLLGRIVEAVTGAPLSEVAAKTVFEPLGMASTRFCPPPQWTTRCAATETGPDGVAKCGVVHDENAESLGGIAGHAGLFATAPDIARYVASWSERDAAVVSGDMWAEALRCQTGSLPARRGLGWALRGDRWDHMGTRWPQTGAGHTGFTGTSIALDPMTGQWVVLLTNAVHLGRDARGIVELRRGVHDSVAVEGGPILQDRGNK